VIPAAENELIKPKAYVVVRDGARDRIADERGRAALTAELQEHVKGRLSKHKYPRWVVFVDDLPKNDRGKVDKKALKEREASGGAPAR
jgi:acyl-coenzyme A synthetase/AMP-(fatty) acid ligase